MKNRTINITQYFEMGKKIKEERFIFGGLIETRKYVYGFDNQLQQELFFIGKFKKQNLREDVMMHFYEPEYDNESGKKVESWHASTTRLELEYENALIRSYYENSLKTKEFDFGMNQISHYQYHLKNDLVGEKVWIGKKDRLGNLIEKVLSYGYSYKKDEYDDYHLEFVNPSGGDKRWKLTDYKANGACEIEILGKYETLVIIYEIIQYLQETFEKITSVFISCANYETGIKLTEEEHEKLYPDGEYQKKYGFLISVY
jgi:hypothetical protein